MFALPALFTGAPFTRSSSTDAQAQLDAIRRTHAVISFDPDGTILEANGTFLDVMGYDLEEVVGQHHAMFMPEGQAAKPEYEEFWAKLRRGEAHAKIFLRSAKGGRPVWLRATYAPILDRAGETRKIVKYATDVTEEKRQSQQHEALDRAQSVLEFDLSGVMLRANSNYRELLGYTASEIEGARHEMLSSPAGTDGAASRGALEGYRRGASYSGRHSYTRRDGEEVWLYVSCNPVFDEHGEAYKVVEYASDVTESVREERRLRSGVDEMLGVINAVAQGDLTKEIGITGEDAVGKMAGGLRRVIEHLRGSIGQIAENAEHLASAAEQMSATSEQMDTTAEATAAQADTVASVVDGMDENVQAVATGAEELSASLGDVAESTGEATRISEAAVTAAAETNETVVQLGTSSAEIGEVIEVINSIAQQTNLLALNATIEAARAGEAGKGFAVVADEVKKLSEQTADATEGIREKIEAIQSDTGEAVSAIDDIGRVIGEVNDIQGGIAHVVKEQSATTDEIARSATEAATRSGEIAENIVGVAEATDEARSGARASQEASAELARLATGLKDVVAQFAYR